MTKKLDTKLVQLNELEKTLDKLSEEKNSLRKEVLEILQTENLNQYKSEVATVSTSERKTVKYLYKPDELLDKLPKKYIVIIPEHKEISPELEKDVKNGLKVEGVELETKENIIIRLNK